MANHTVVLVAGLAATAAAGAVALVLFLRKSGPPAHPHPTGTQPTHTHKSGDDHGHTHTKGTGIRPVSSLPKRGYTKEELIQFDGVKNPHIFVSLKRKVYEVAPQFYGPGGPYHIFAGKEASRCLGKSQLDGKDVNKYWVDCTEEELETLDDYVETFESKYPVVGWFIPDQTFYDV